MSRHNERWEDEPSQEGTGAFQDLRGIPYSAFKTKGEMMLAQQAEILEELRRRGEMVSVSPNIEIFPPEISINIPDFSRSREFENLVDAQQRLVEYTDKLNYLGQQAVEQQVLSNEQLKLLGYQGRVAWEQRNRQLEVAVQANQHLFGIGQGVAGVQNQIRQGFHGLGGLVDDRLSEANALLGDLYGNISFGINKLHKGLRGISKRLELYGSAMLDSLSDIGHGINGMTKEMVATRLSLIEKLKQLGNIFLWSHRENMLAQRNILDAQRGALYALRNPMQTRAFESWKIGERCRLAKDYEPAIKKMKNGLDDNPSEPRLYLSLGIIFHEKNKPEDAIPYFEKAALYAEINCNPELSSHALLYAAKSLIYNNLYQEAVERLEQALEKNIRDFACWYELAYCHAKLGNKEDAATAIRILFTRAPEYRAKIVGEQAFLPLIDIILKFLKN